MRSFATVLALFYSLRFANAATFNLQDEYAGNSFFDKWDFYGAYDNLTNGDVTWVSKDVAMSKKLVEINSAGNAIMRVSTENVVWDNKRDSVRITSQKAYPLGTIWITDVLHLPFGCSMWPAIWTLGQNTANWPNDGEIDILEGINLNTNNQMALHTAKGCKHSTSITQTGKSLQPDCSVDAGCTVQDQDTKSYGDAFNQAGGGIWATEFTKERVNIWFWSRNSIPDSVKKLVSSKDPITSQGDWGTPSANYPAGSDCDMEKAFTPQKFVYDITLCGTWGKNLDFYLPQCSFRGPTKNEYACYNDNVAGNGTNYVDAYFEVKYLRAYVDPNAPKVKQDVPSGGWSSGNSSSGSQGKSSAAMVTVPVTSYLFSAGALTLAAMWMSSL